MVSYKRHPAYGNCHGTQAIHALHMAQCPTCGTTWHVNGGPTTTLSSAWIVYGFNYDWGVVSSLDIIYSFIFGIRDLTIIAKRCFEHIYGHIGCGLQEIETVGFEECLKMWGKALICRVQFCRRVNTPNEFAIL